MSGRRPRPVASGRAFLLLLLTALLLSGLLLTGLLLSALLSRHRNLARIAPFPGFRKVQREHAVAVRGLACLAIDIAGQRNLPVEALVLLRSHPLALIFLPLLAADGQHIVFEPD